MGKLAYTITEPFQRFGIGHVDKGTYLFLEKLTLTSLQLLSSLLLPNFNGR